MKNHLIITTALVVGLTFLDSTLCHAQSASPKQKQFERIDTDKNGEISLEEFKAKTKTPDTAEEKFAKIDTDKNGSLSLEEWTAKGKKDPQAAE
ncbi:MAG: EF-hand domain-containing protein [Chthoniobacterales bacterium]|jgi:Ca2+-binding EF-hand superfamily protein